MIRNPLNFIYGSTPAEFRSAFGLSESVARLRAATRRFAFGVLAEQAAVGSVGESRVRLQRVIPMVGNSFKPFFVGRFEERAEAVYLTGHFTMLGFAKVFMTIWLGGVLTLGIAIGVTAPSRNWLPALASFGMFGAGVALVGLGKWLSRNDAVWLANTIRTALDTPVAGQPPGLAAPPVSTPGRSTPTVLRVTALVLLVMGVLGFSSALSGISFWQAGLGQATIVRHFSSWPPRLEVGAFGAWMSGLAFGVYRRKQWAWRLGLVSCGLAGLTSVLQAFTASDLPDDTAIKVIFCVSMLGGTLYWSWWWYAQRIHFLSQEDQVSNSALGRK